MDEKRRGVIHPIAFSGKRADYLEDEDQTIVCPIEFTERPGNYADSPIEFIGWPGNCVDSPIEFIERPGGCVSSSTESNSPADGRSGDTISPDKKMFEISKKQEEPIKPISFYALQKDENGILREVGIENDTLAGQEIPSGVDPKEFEKFIMGYFRTENSKNKGSVPAKKESQKDGNQQVIHAGESTGIANYELKPLFKRIYLDRTGAADDSRSEIAVEIIINTKSRRLKSEFSIKCSEIEKIAKVVGRRYNSAIIYDKGAVQELENDFREKTEDIKIVTCYVDAGWQRIGGRYIYLHKDCEIRGAEILTKLSLPSYPNYQSRDIIDAWKKAKAIYRNSEVGEALMVYSFLGISYKIFEEAGFAPHFLLFLSGKTGSLKTTLAKIFYTQLCEEKFREFPRRIDTDTKTSFERALVSSGRDTVTLFDDYSPAKSLQKKKEMEENLESIVRMVGDGSTKSRSNAGLEDCRGEGVQGMVVLTGELKGKGLSSNLRCLYLEMERENANLEIVSWFQENKYAYTTLLQHFACFLSGEWQNIVAFVEEKVEAARCEAEGYLKERRLVDTLATLWIMLEIIGQFLIRYCGEQENSVRDEISRMHADLVNVVVRSELLSNEEDPAVVFMKALVSMVEGRKINIMPRRLQEAELERMDGFEDDSYVYLLPDNIYHKVTAWLRMGGLYFGTDISQIGNLLCNAGYAVTTPNGSKKKLYYARVDIGGGKKVKFLKILKTAIKKFQDMEVEAG